MILFSSCSSDSEGKNTITGASIQVVDERFNVTIDECIGILNESFAEKDLCLIPIEYEILKHNNWVTYRNMINERLMIRFSVNEDENIGFIRIGLSYLENAKYDKEQKKKTIDDSVKKHKEARRYYRIICDSIVPHNNVIYTLKNVKGCDSFTYILEDIAFHSSQRTISGDGRQENIRTYEVISNEELFYQYEDEIDEDKTVFFR